MRTLAAVWILVWATGVCAQQLQPGMICNYGYVGPPNSECRMSPTTTRYLGPRVEIMDIAPQAYRPPECVARQPAQILVTPAFSGTGGNWIDSRLVHNCLPRHLDPEAQARDRDAAARQAAAEHAAYQMAPVPLAPGADFELANAVRQQGGQCVNVVALSKNQHSMGQIVCTAPAGGHLVYPVTIDGMGMALRGAPHHIP